MLKNHIRIIILTLALVTSAACIYGYFSKALAVTDALSQGMGGICHTCTINSYPVHDGTKIKFYARVEHSSSSTDITGYNLYVTAPDDVYDIAKYGATVSITCPITVADTAPNYGNFDYRYHLLSKNTIGILYVENSADIKRVAQADNIATAMHALQRKAIFNISKYFNGSDRALITAILTGDRSEFGDDMFEKYKISGIYHIVAVSGLHTSIFVAIVAYLISILPMRNRRRATITKTAAIVVSVMLFMFTGFGISIARVILMSAMIWLGLLFRREYSLVMSVAASAWIVIIFMPYQILSSSFQLSFLSTLGICIALGIMQRLKNTPWSNNKWLASLAMSAGSTVATAPICAFRFGAISLSGLIFNLMAIPAATILLVSSLLFSIASVILPEGAMLVLRIVPLFFARVINAIATIGQKLAFLYVSVNLNMVIIVMATVLTIGIIIYQATKHHYMRSVITACLIVAINLSLFAYNHTQTGRLRVTFVNAAQGEATLVRTPDGRNIMFDCGSASYKSPAKDLFVSYFVHNGIQKIDKLYISYFDRDHTNAINTLIGMGYIKQIVFPPQVFAKSEYITANRNKILDTADKYNVPVTHMHREMIADEGNNLQISFAKDNFDMTDKNGCAVYRITYNDVSFVLSSCLGAKGQSDLTDLPQCTVLKIPNYGNKVKATKQYILSQKPQYAVITTPANSKYAKLDDGIVDILSKNNIPYARTDINQTTTFVTSGDKIDKVITRKGSLK